MNLAQGWQHGRTQLTPTSPTPKLDARLLLEHLLGVDHATLIAHGDDPLTPDQLAAYQALLDRAQQREPIPYITGHAPFFDMELVVSPAVLIPRPETEQLVETAVAWAAAHSAKRAADIGTGSGCIAISLARRLPHCRVTAVDISPAALTIAQQNAHRYAPDRIQCQQGSLLEPISTPVDLILANLPYVTSEEWTMLDDGVKWYEPALALQGGEDGLELIRPLLQQATTKLTPGGAIFLEIGWRQGTAVCNLAQQHFPTATIKLIPDFAGQDRIVAITTD
ncbi:MAG: peptide chain release factor N(5)-glutamine methyltransferase [Anaerolineae bacterium]